MKKGRIIFNMTMSVNDENSAGAANNNNCSKTADLDDHYVNSPGDLRSQMWPPCPPPPPPPSSAWLPDEPPTYTPLVKVEPPAAMGPLATSNTPSSIAGGGHVSTDCSGCGEKITDRFILQVAGSSWHGHCLRCCICHTLLDGHASCFLREEQLYCKLDYTKLFGAKCYKCARMISPADWVRKAKDQVYHLACFACDSCKRQLSTGEEFGISENRVLCKVHYMETIDGGCTSSDESGDAENHTKKKTKRMRTTFTEEQVQILQANFQIDSNPDGQDLERIAQITGLSKRVTQVWFQNCRARQKKYINSGKRSGSASSTNSSKSIPINGLSPVPRDQCGNNSGGNAGIDLHPMYSSFRTAGPPPPPLPPQQPPSNDGSNDATEVSYTTLGEV